MKKKVFGDILEMNRTFLDYKNEGYKTKSKNWHFSKTVNMVLIK